jgi:hypothetical protein
MLTEAMSWNLFQKLSIGQSGRPTITLMKQEPKDLWPSGRGTEIGVIFSTMEAFILALAKKSGKLRRHPSAIVHPEDDLCAVILWGVDGEKAISIVSEPHLATDRISVVADLNADVIAVSKALRDLLGNKFLVHQN